MPESVPDPENCALFRNKLCLGPPECPFLVLPTPSWALLPAPELVRDSGPTTTLQGNAAMKDLRILVTGGTIDKVHDTRSEGLSFSPDGSTHIPELLRIGRCHFPTVELLMLKDSLYFDDADRAAIASAVAAAPEPAIVITHGTGTMGETARFLAGRTGDRTVVLTGAMRPFSLYASDGEFNLGGAIVAAQLLAPGVWGVMNGRVFEAARLDKNVEQGRFDA